MLKDFLCIYDVELVKEHKKSYCTTYQAQFEAMLQNKMYY